MKVLRFILRTLLFGWLLALVDLVKVLCRIVKRRCKPGTDGDRSAKSKCVPIDDPAFVRPDPLIYAQYYLTKLGLAVTWDNPDIELRLNGVPVASSTLAPGTTYEVVARIWNASTTAPVIAMPVHFSYLDFGIGTKKITVGTVSVDLGVKGGPNHPAHAAMPWVTPSTPGHYCLQVELDPADDLNRLNNLGQENTNVGQAHSPAIFHFKLRNDTRRPRSYTFDADAYTLGSQDTCGEERSRARLTRHQRGAQPVPAGWQVQLDPPTPTLQPDEVIEVRATLTPPTGFVGSQVFNVNAFHDDGLAGGVTLTVMGS